MTHGMFIHIILTVDLAFNDIDLNHHRIIYHKLVSSVEHDTLRYVYIIFTIDLSLNHNDFNYHHKVSCKLVNTGKRDRWNVHPYHIHC